jgi:hypothetical protein
MANEFERPRARAALARLEQRRIAPDAKVEMLLAIPGDIPAPDITDEEDVSAEE